MQLGSNDGCVVFQWLLTTPRVWVYLITQTEGPSSPVCLNVVLTKSLLFQSLLFIFSFPISMFGFPQLCANRLTFPAKVHCISVTFLLRQECLFGEPV